MPNKNVEVGKTARRRQDHRGRTYGVTLTWSIVSGELRPTAVEVVARGGVDASMLRNLPLAAIADEGRPAMAKLYEGHLGRPELSEAGRKQVRAVLMAARAPKDDPDLLELIATTYRQAALKTRAPTKTVHEELVKQGHELSRQQVGKLVMRCREVGLLGPAEPGRAGERPRRKGAGK
jgi:hypothetical protein